MERTIDKRCKENERGERERERERKRKRMKEIFRVFTRSERFVKD